MAELFRLRDENAALKAELEGEKAAALNYRAYAIKAEKRRDELLAALKNCVAVCSGESISKSSLIYALSTARDAISSVKGGA